MAQKAKILTRATADEKHIDPPVYYDLLNKRKEELLKLSHRDREEIDQGQTTGGAPGDDGDLSIMDAQSDYFLTLADRDRKELIEIRNALEKLHQGTYGICENCDQQISPARLRHIPQARLCITCQSNLENYNKRQNPRVHPKT